ELFAFPVADLEHSSVPEDEAQVLHDVKVRTLAHILQSLYPRLSRRAWEGDEVRSVCRPIEQRLEGPLEPVEVRTPVVAPQGGEVKFSPKAGLLVHHVRVGRERML